MTLELRLGGTGDGGGGGGEPGLGLDSWHHLLQSNLQSCLPWSCPVPLRQEPKDKAGGCEESKALGSPGWASHTLPQPCPPRTTTSYSGSRGCPPAAPAWPPLGSACLREARGELQEEQKPPSLLSMRTQAGAKSRAGELGQRGAPGCGPAQGPDCSGPPSCSASCSHWGLVLPFP